MTKKIGTPRPPKDGAIKFQYGRWEGEYCIYVDGKWLGYYKIDDYDLEE